MNDDRRKRITQSFRTLGRVLAVIVLTAFVASWFVWGPFGAIFYVGGLLNSLLPFMLVMLFMLLPWAVFVAVIYALVLTAHTVYHWSRLDAWRKGYRLFAAIAFFAWPVSYGLEYSEIVVTPHPLDLFVRGLAEYVDCRADIGAIQNWLGTLDPNDWEDEWLEVGFTLKGSISDSPDSVPIPPSLARLGWDNKTLTLDDRGCPMIRITLGGAGLIGCWGLEMGSPDMPMPASDSHFLYYPFAPGACIWSGD